MNSYFNNGFHEQGVIKVLDVFNCWEEHRNSPKLIMDAFRYLIDCSDRANTIGLYKKLIPTRVQLFEKSREHIRRYVQYKQLPFAREIADTLLTYFPEYRDKILQCLEEEEHPETKQLQDKDKNVYVNGQNVHDDSITASFLEAGTQLCLLTADKTKFGISSPPMIFQMKLKIRSDILSDAEVKLSAFTHNDEIVRTGLKFIDENFAKFGKSGITITDVFLALWVWINEPKRPQRQLYSRLIEEFHEMNGMCSSGHIARLVNVIQGFTDDERLMIRISNAEQCRTVVKTYLNKIFKECTDEKILNGLIEHDEKFISFVRDKIAQKLLEWQDDYGKDFLPYIGQSVNDYCKCEVFKNSKK